ncbi:CHASE3 domain-containing protein [Calothrix sp. NIES-2098]|uniref:CHASE3 domain-containing protein n=1 Tax=Calothrix sp. NIES-2098 TaxID=1954171 RepID=UPI000B6151FE|nr:two-component hybrid sensor and regulator [Calothrix sp. NIES-2098]
MLQITQIAFRRRLLGAIALPIILLLLLSGVSIWQITRLLSAMQWVDHTDRVISQANYLQKLLLDIETGVRGYQLTGTPEFLEPYQQASSKINTAFDRLGDLVADNPTQAKRLKDIRSEQVTWYKSINQAIARQQRGEVESLAGLKDRKQITDLMRRQIADFIATEEQLRNQRADTAQKTTQIIILTSILLSIAIGGLIGYFIKWQLAKVSRSYENALSTAQEQTKNAQNSAQRLVALHEIDLAILAAESIELLIVAALQQMHQLVPYQQAFVALFDFKTRTGRIIAGHSVTGELQPPEGTQMPLTDFAREQSWQQDIYCVEDLTTENSYPPILAQLRLGGIRCCLCIPMLVEQTLLGELYLTTTQTAAFDTQTQDIAREVTAQLAIAIQQSLLREQLQNYASELEQRVSDRTADLQVANQELEAFTYSISHDLRAPLRTMQGFAQALLEDYSDQLDSIGQEYIEYITEGAVQMDTLINDLLAYSRLSRVDIQLNPVDLTLVVEEALKQISAQIQEQQAKVTVISPLPQVIAHRPTLIQVVTNLLSNAIKFVKPGIQPEVKVYAQEQKDWINLWVIDNGIGIAPQHQERIFNVFERLHGVETYPGTGIGLAIVRKSIERMGGRAGVESQPSIGSRFWIALPKANFHPHATTDSSTQGSSNR